MGCSEFAQWHGLLWEVQGHQCCCFSYFYCSCTLPCALCEVPLEGLCLAGAAGRGLLRPGLESCLLQHLSAEPQLHSTFPWLFFCIAMPCYLLVPVGWLPVHGYSSSALPLVFLWWDQTVTLGEGGAVPLSLPEPDLVIKAGSGWVTGQLSPVWPYARCLTAVAATFVFCPPLPPLLPPGAIAELWNAGGFLAWGGDVPGAVGVLTGCS